MKLTTPVMYDPSSSSYSDADALKVFSDVGARLGLLPPESSHVFFVSSGLVSRVADTAVGVGSRGAAVGRRWFARNLEGEDEGTHLATSCGLSFCSRAVGLTTLSPLADADGEREAELRRRAARAVDKAKGERLKERTLSFYRETMLYETVMHLHRLFF